MAAKWANRCMNELSVGGGLSGACRGEPLPTSIVIPTTASVGDMSCCLLVSVGGLSVGGPHEGFVRKWEDFELFWFAALRNR